MKRSARLGAVIVVLCVVVLGIWSRTAGALPSGFQPLQLLVVAGGQVRCSATVSVGFSTPTDQHDFTPSSAGCSLIRGGTDAVSSADIIPLQVHLLEPGMPPLQVSSVSGFASVESPPASSPFVPGFSFAAASMQGLGDHVLVSNPNPFPVGIVVSVREWGFGFNTARAVGLHGLQDRLSVLNLVSPDDDDVVSRSDFREITPDVCRESGVQKAGKFQAGSLNPFFIVPDPANSSEVSFTGEFRLGTCSTVPAVVPAMSDLAVAFALAELSASVSIPQPSPSGPVGFVQASSTGLAVTTIGLADMPFTARLTELVVTAHSPVDVIITDPNGRRIGFDPVEGHYVAEIPGGQYSGHGSEPQTVVVPMPAAGTYSIQAKGTGTGPYSISVQSLDQLGNVLSQTSFTGAASPGSTSTMTTSLTMAGILGGVDTIPPVTTAGLAPSPNAVGWNNTNVTVALSSTDNEPGGTGVKEIHFSLAGAQAGSGVVGGSTASVSIASEGSTILTYFAVDNAGNQEAAKTVTVRIDKTPPIIAGLPAPGCTLWPPNHQMVQVGTVAASDGLSGFAPGSLTVTGTSNEPVNGLGDGNTTPDIMINGGTVQIRAERSATGTGRVYTLTASASDLAGNRAIATATCTVPHDQGGTD